MDLQRQPFAGGQQLVGATVSVHWAGDTWYKGLVDAWDDAKKLHHVKYFSVQKTQWHMLHGEDEARATAILSTRDAR